MRIFVTGATGFIGSTIVRELLQAGHAVLGLTRSEAGAQSLAALDVQAHRGDIEDLDSLRRGADMADGVIHTAFNHDFSQFVTNCENDRAAITAMGEVLQGSRRPLLITSGTGMGATGHGQPASEDAYDPSHPNPRKASEEAGMALLERDVHVSVVRLPQVHDPLRQGLISPLIEVARQKGVSAFIGEGRNRWPAVHVSDAARVYVLALHKALQQEHPAGSRYHAVAEEGIAMRSIAEEIGRGLGVPVQGIATADASAHFGWLAAFAGYDMPASGTLTRQRLGWEPKGPDLLSDLRLKAYV